MDTNYAAFLVGHMRKPLLVGETEVRLADENEIVIRNAAVAVNKIDVLMQDAPWSIPDYPLILGTDVAGEVVEVGSQVPNFGVGDRVLGHALRLATEDDRHAAFQHYTVLMPNMACAIPPTMSYESAAVLPLGVSTAAAGLFQDDTLALEPPRVYPQKKNVWVIVMGATGSVGSNAVRLAVAAGYNVIATASPRNFEIARQLGAAQVVDYNSPNLVYELVHALYGDRIAGAFDATGREDSIKAAVATVSRCEGNQVVATVADWIDPAWDLCRSVKTKPIMAVAIRENKVGKMVYEDFLPHALAVGTYMRYPKPLVYGEGLSSIQGALGKSKDGKATRGKKVVVTLS
ncbi:hypothetical protein SLS62_010969 [Diatrype stigma]|uniref:Enoyl reductase (ER) domain-containing protein n=1 Tax=Diatrype stigma TaxID=117547 RepID=A0AAN9YGJ0_9PEZI